jgi:hypothetical protein
MEPPGFPGRFKPTSTGDYSTLSLALATVAKSGASDSPFLGGAGVAVSRTGAVYASTGPNATSTPYAIVELTTSEHAQVLWFDDWWVIPHS